MSAEKMITVDNYFLSLAEKRLMGSKCPKCGTIDLPPRRLCSECLAESNWLELSGKGELKTFSSIYVGAEVMINKGYDRKHPYVFAVCKMDEGPSISGQLIGVDENHPENILIGMKIQATYLKSEIGKGENGNPIYRWDVGFEPQK